MGRPSKLTPEQWADVDRRLLEGESIRSVSRDFPITEASIRGRLAKIGKAETVQKVAAKIVDAERSLAALPLPQQLTAQNLAAKLRSISDSLASAAELGAKTAHRLQALSNSEVAKVDDANPMASLENLRNVGVLTKLANESASISLSLLAANKETVVKINNEQPPEQQAPARPQISREQWLKEHGLS